MDGNLQLLVPRARQNGLVVRELGGEVLVYDLERDKAHALNRAAGLVWKRCNGSTTIAEITASLEGELDEPMPADAVWRAVSRLGQDGLLEREVAQPAPRTMTRRGMMQKVGLAATAAVITSIAVPMTAAAANCPSTTCGGGCPNSGTTCSATSPGGSACATCTAVAIGSCSHRCCIASGVCVTAADSHLCCMGSSQTSGCSLGHACT
jgi:hypothetical protein